MSLAPAGLAACLLASCSCKGSAGAHDAAPAADAAPPVRLEPVWQTQTLTPILMEMVPGAGGVVVLGGPKIQLHGPDGSVLASADMPLISPPDNYDNVLSAKPTSGGGFAFLTGDRPWYVSAHGPDLQQMSFVDTQAPVGSNGGALVTAGDRTYVLHYTQDALSLSTIEAGGMVSTREVSLPQGQTFFPDQPTLVAGDGALLFAGNGSANGTAGIALLRLNPEDANGSVVAVDLLGNEIQPISMLRTDQKIIVVVADFDDHPPNSAEYLTALALDDTGTKVVQEPVRIEQRDRVGWINDFTIVGNRVVGLQPTADGFHLVSFNTESFAPCPDVRLALPPDSIHGPEDAGYMAQYDGALYVAMSIQTGLTAYTLLERLPPLDPPAGAPVHQQ